MFPGISCSIYIMNIAEMTAYRIVNVFLTLMFVIAIILMILIIRKNKCSLVNVALTCVCFLAIPICTLPLYLVFSEVTDVYSLMLYSVMGIFIFILVMADMVAETGTKSDVIIKPARWITEMLCLMVVVIYSNYANAQYLAADMSIREAESYYTTMITSIKMQEGYCDDMKVIVVGSTITDASVYENEKISYFANSVRPESLVNAYSRQKLMEDYL